MLRSLVGSEMCIRDRCPIMPIAQFEHADGAEWEWTRTANNGARELLGQQQSYTPTLHDLENTLILRVVPTVAGEEPGLAVECRSGSNMLSKPCEPNPDGPVISWAPNGYFHHRHIHTPAPLDKTGLRVLSYNLLADYNLKQEMRRGEDIYFGAFHEKTQELSWHHRRQLLLQEVVGYHADLLLLQEVDRDSGFENFFSPHLGLVGFNGLYANKAHTSTPVGQALFWRTDRYNLLAECTLDLTQPPDLHQGSSPQAMAISECIRGNDALSEAMSKTTSVAQIAMLQPTCGRCLCVANNHFFGDPAAPHIRLLQSAMVLEQCRDMMEQHNDEAILLVGGDFNSGINEGICEFLGTGRVDKSHVDWLASTGYVWGANIAEKAENQGSTLLEGCTDGVAVTLKHDWDMANAVTGLMEHTWIGHVRQFGLESLACVDHVFYDCSKLKLTGLVPEAPAELIQEHGAPSSAFASDHVAVVVDLAFL
eukprot:TRINITY_DN4545_c0_g2_i3.p1 TRINITY_DN4545_c0_g2~~TRINITY_DN4545_c0_g2_i3.p1  ORF type:complete len:480 (+),score=76.86 TRINITY_DN4545_c0_g2_i3:88-1527(+)